jgi:hypothetical protein
VGTILKCRGGVNKRKIKYLRLCSPHGENKSLIFIFVKIPFVAKKIIKVILTKKTV